MKENLKYAVGLLNNAINLVLIALGEFKKDYSSPSNIVFICTNAIELCGKAIFKALELEFPKEHQLLFDKKGEIFPETKKLFQKISYEYPHFKDYIRRVIYLTYVWNNRRTLAKYGIPNLNEPPDSWIIGGDAVNALCDALECISITHLFILSIIVNN
jgi:hypothetical protein